MATLDDPLLGKKTACISELTKYNGLTSPLFVLAALLTVVVSAFSYVRITLDIAQREKLQLALTSRK